MGCNCKSDTLGENGIDTSKNNTTHKILNWVSRILTFSVVLVLLPFIMLYMVWHIFRMIVLDGSNVIDIKKGVEYYKDKMLENKEIEIEEDFEINPEDYKLITPIDKVK